MGLYGGVERDGSDGQIVTPDSVSRSWHRRGFHVALATVLLLATAFAVAVIVDSSTRASFASSLDETDDAGTESTDADAQVICKNLKNDTYFACCDLFCFVSITLRS